MVVENIKIYENDILSGNISQLKTVVEKFSINRELAVENENNISITFSGMTFVDLSRKLQDEQYKTWFKKMDAEIPYLPFFLNDKSKTLMFFMLGNIKYSIENNKIIPDETERASYIKKKTYEIRNFCFPHNINPTPAIKRLNGTEMPEQKHYSIESLLDRFGAIAFMTSQREIQLSILINQLPSDIKLWGPFYTAQGCAQPFFTVFMQENEENIEEHKAVIISSSAEIEESLDRNPSVTVVVLTKAEKGLELCLELERKSENLTVDELQANKRQIIEKYTKNAVNNEESRQTAAEEQQSETETPDENAENETEEPDKKVLSEATTLPLTVETLENQPEPAEKVEEKEKKEKKQEETEEKIPENETNEEKIARLEREIAQLKEKIEKQAKLIEDYEEELNKKRSVKGFFKRFFS